MLQPRHPVPPNIGFYHKSPIISPNPKSKPAISRPYYFTLIPRGIRKVRKRPDMPITHPSRKNKPGIPPRQKEHLDKKFLYFYKVLVCESSD